LEELKNKLGKLIAQYRDGIKKFSNIEYSGIVLKTCADSFLAFPVQLVSLAGVKTLKWNPKEINKKKLDFKMINDETYKNWQISELRFVLPGSSEYTQTSNAVILSYTEGRPVLDQAAWNGFAGWTKVMMERLWNVLEVSHKRGIRKPSNKDEYVEGLVKFVLPSVSPSQLSQILGEGAKRSDEDDDEDDGAVMTALEKELMEDEILMLDEIDEIEDITELINLHMQKIKKSTAASSGPSGSTSLGSRSAAASASSGSSSSGSKTIVKTLRFPAGEAITQNYGKDFFPEGSTQIVCNTFCRHLSVSVLTTKVNSIC
jgi:hypothetical protein